MLFFWESKKDETQNPPIFYGTVLHHKVKKPRQKYSKKERKKILKLALLLFVLCLVTLLLGVCACIYTLYVHDQLFDAVVYSTVIVAVLFLFSALVSVFYALLSK